MIETLNGPIPEEMIKKSKLSKLFLKGKVI